MRTNSKFSRVICLVLVAAMAIVPMFTLTTFATTDVTFLVPEGAEVVEGAANALPTATVPDELAGYEFAGWSATKVEDDSTEVTLVTEYPTTATKLYAVYSYGGAVSYEKYTGTITAGKYLIVYDNGAMKAAVASNRLSYTDLSSEDFTAPDSSLVWTVAANGDYWTLYNENTASYAAGTGSKNKATLSTSVTDYAKWTVTGSDTYEFVNLGNETKGVNKTLRKNGTYGFACYATSTGGALTLYKETASTSYTSGNVVESETVNLMVAGKNYKTETVKTGETVNLPVLDSNSTYTFKGWAEEAVVDAANAPELYNGEYTVNKDVTLYAVYSHVSESAGGYVLVTDVNQLAVGKKIILVGESNALSTNQKSSNRGATAVAVSNNAISTIGDDVQVITLEAGTTSGTYSFNVGTGYLYAASSSGNQLKTKATLDVNDVNASWTINISDGAATVIAEGSSNRNRLRYNPNNGTPLFACYANDDTGSWASIYMEGSVETTLYTTDVEVVNPDAPEISDVSVTVGKNLAMNYTVFIPEEYDISGVKMVFTMNNATTEVVSYEDLGNGYYSFTFNRIAPQCMGDSINAELYVNGESADTYNGYSVKAYAEKLLAIYGDNTSDKYDENVVNLVVDMLNYGAAAQVYRDYKTDAPVNANLGEAGSNAEPTVSDRASSVTESTNENYGFTAAGVRFDYINKVYVKFSAPSLENVTVLVNGAAAEAVATNGGYKVYSDAISALDFDTVLTFELQVEGVTVQTLTYSVNSYAYAKYDDGDAMGNLALALYRYGVSAKNYANN